MRLIDADTLQYLVDCLQNDSLLTPSTLRHMIDSVQTVDGVPVVRCKDCCFCIHQQMANNDNITYICGGHGIVSPMHYCSFGVQKNI